MPAFTKLVRFLRAEGGKPVFASTNSSLPQAGTEIVAYESFVDLETGRNPQLATIGKLLSPTPDPEVPIYCVGLNYTSHAVEAKLNEPKYPPLWTKPKAALADPDEDIPVSRFCAQNLLDYEGELVFITSKECRDVSPADAKSYILGYTVGNDLSCRSFQAPAACGGQFYFAKAFDKFAPMGPALISSEEFEKLGDAVRLTTKVNNEEVQSTQCPQDMIFKPAEILSFMSQGTTIPAFTAVMTGTPAGVGLFRNGGTFLKDGDVIEIEMEGVGILKNKLVFE